MIENDAEMWFEPPPQPRPPVFDEDGRPGRVLAERLGISEDSGIRLAKALGIEEPRRAR